MQIRDENLVIKAQNTLRQEGIRACFGKSKRFIHKKIRNKRSLKAVYKDILFISGCDEKLPHPLRYRVAHQREQLEAFNYSTDEVYYLELILEQVKYYKAFIFFRCPYTEQIGKFVRLAKYLNKRIIYDIDDLVIDTKYTDLIKYVKEMNVDDKAAYDMNVMNMQKLLKKCDIAITTTECLAEELKKYVSQVFINRNVASEEMLKLSELALRGRVRDSHKVKIGYFSGSITHNADFGLIMIPIRNIMKKYPYVELHLMGEVDLPEYLLEYKSRIIKIPFLDWRKLPEKIAEVDINLAPLEKTVFNEAKSENKWVEAAMVKVVTVASDVGAFHHCIENGKTGILCNSAQDWEEKLEQLILQPEIRRKIAENANMHCMKNCTTIGNGYKIARFMKNEIPDQYVFILPGLEISGGMRVVLKHATILRRNMKDVTFFILDGKEGWYETEKYKFPVINLQKTSIEGYLSYAIATMWTTVDFLEKYPNINNRLYLVQNYETDFYKNGDCLRLNANKTYMSHNHVKFLTISKWCQEWLCRRYGQKAKYVLNGLETNLFPFHRRKLEGRIRILIEGDCAVEYKNVDEAFRIVDRLDSNMYEIWYMSYNAKPKKEYRIDRFLHKVPYEKVVDVYNACDILLKTSVLESFSYPPLEMMATGGYVVAVPNGGNREYLEHEYNCIFYQQGNLTDGKRAIERIVRDKKLQEQLYINGRETALNRDWIKIEKMILEMYSSKSEDIVL